MICEYIYSHHTLPSFSLILSYCSLRLQSKNYAASGRGIRPEEIKHSLTHVTGIKEVLDIRARWSGHQLLAEIFIKVDSTISVIEAHDIIEDVEHEVMHHIKYISSVIVDIEPENHIHKH